MSKEMNGRLTAGILLFDNVDDLDFTGPLEVLNQVRLNEERRFAERTPVDILLVARDHEPVKTFGGMLVAQDCSFGECPPLDVLVVPGGMGERLENHNPVILDFIRKRAAEVKTLASVCTGAFLLAGAGVLDGRAATTHSASIDRMKDSFPKVKVEEGVRVRRGREVHHVGRYLVRDRHDAQARGDTLRRGHSPRDRPLYRIPLPRRQLQNYRRVRQARPIPHEHASGVRSKDTSFVIAVDVK